MQIAKRHYKLCLFLTTVAFFTSLVSAQSTLHWLKEGIWYPVYEVRGNDPWCFTGDELVKGKDDSVTMLSAQEFGPGYLEVEILSNRRKGVVKHGDMLQFVAETGWFEFTARVTANDDLGDVYFVMRFDRLGDAIFKCRHAGDMKAGQSRVIQIFSRVDYEMPKQIHFYSGMQEIRTNLVPETYSYQGGDFLLASN